MSNMQREGIVPSNDNIRIMKFQRRQTIAIVVIVGVIFGGLLILGMIANGGRIASEDSSNSTDAQLLNGVRNACITDRRNIQTNAQGQMLKATLLAQRAAYLKDLDEFHRQVDAGLAAIKAQDKASDQLDPKVINKPPPIGCGPPITSRKQLQKGGD